MQNLWKALYGLTEKHPYIVLTILSAALFFPLLGSYPLLGQWETHYGRVAMEMLLNKNGIWDWFLDPIYLDQYNFWSKPIFCFWMVLPFYAALGPTEWATRIPFAVNGILCLLLVYWTIKRFFHGDHSRAFITALVLMLTPFYYLITKQFMWDITAVSFIYGGVMFLYLGMRDDDRRLVRLSYVFWGLAMLAKGLLAVVIPGGIFFIWMLATADYGLLAENGGVKKVFLQYGDFLKKTRIIEGIGLFLLVSAWWYLYMYAKHGVPFLKEFFIENHFGRMEGLIDKPDGPFEFYLWQIAIGAFPWFALFIPGLIFAGDHKEHKREEGFIIMSFFFIFLFFTLSATKFPHYIFPAMPFFAAIVAIPIIEFFRGERRTLYPLAAVLGALILGVTGKDLGTGINYRELLYIITTHRVQDWFGRVYDMLPWLYALVPPMVFFLLLPLVRLKSTLLMRISLVGFSTVAVAFAAYINFYWVPKVLWVFTPKQLVERYLEVKEPGDLIVDYDNWKNRCLYFYLGTDEQLIRANTPAAVKKLIEDNPTHTVYITTKKNKIPELRSVLMTIGVPLTKIMDDAVDTYMEVEMYRASMKDKGSSDDSWKKDLITEDKIPNNIQRTGSTLDDKTVEIIGYKLNKNYFEQGEKIVIDMYYRVLKTTEKNWQIFFHLDVFEGALPHSIKIDEFPLKGFYPTDKWQVGDIIHDQFEATVARGHPGGGIKIYTGFYIGNDRMKVDEQKFNDGVNRFILGTFNIKVK